MGWDSTTAHLLRRSNFSRGLIASSQWNLVKPVFVKQSFFSEKGLALRCAASPSSTQGGLMPDQPEGGQSPDAAKRSEFGKSSRRVFISRLGMAGLLATTAPPVSVVGQRAGAKETDATAAVSKDAILVKLRVNGKEHSLRIA
jgi:hypothetical protein